MHREEWDTEEVLAFVHDVKPWRDRSDQERVEWCRRVNHILNNVVTDRKNWSQTSLAPLLGVSRQVLGERLSWSQAYLAGDRGKVVKPRSAGEQTGDARRAFRNPDIDPEVKAELVAEAMSDPFVASVVASLISSDSELMRKFRWGHYQASGTGRELLTTPPTLEQRWQAWLNRVNANLTEGARLAEKSSNEKLGAHAAIALQIYNRITEKALDAEIRQLLEGAEVSS